MARPARRDPPHVVAGAGDVRPILTRVWAPVVVPSLAAAQPGLPGEPHEVVVAARAALCTPAPRRGDIGQQVLELRRGGGCLAESLQEGEDVRAERSCVNALRVQAVEGQAVCVVEAEVLL